MSDQLVAPQLPDYVWSSIVGDLGHCADHLEANGWDARAIRTRRTWLIDAVERQRAGETLDVGEPA